VDAEEWPGWLLSDVQAPHWILGSLCHQSPSKGRKQGPLEAAMAQSPRPLLCWGCALSHWAGLNTHAFTHSVRGEWGSNVPHEATKVPREISWGHRASMGRAEPSLPQHRGEHQVAAPWKHTLAHLSNECALNTYKVPDMPLSLEMKG
jgi:hypothetical protein